MESFTADLALNQRHVFGTSAESSLDQYWFSHFQSTATKKKLLKGYVPTNSF